MTSFGELVAVGDPSNSKLPKFSPHELVGISFLKETDDGQKLRATIVKKLKSIDGDRVNKLQKTKFIVELGDGEIEEVMEYGELCDVVEQQIENELEDENRIWTFMNIVGHQGPLKPKDPNYKGSSYNVLVRWEDNSETYEPLDVMIKDDPITVANYAKKHNLLEVPGWKRLQKYAKNEKKLKRMLNQVRRANMKFRRVPMYKFGVQVPYDEAEARKLDERNENSKWSEAMKAELEALRIYNTFEDKGKIKHLEGHTRIPVRFVFDVKHDLRHHARLVAGGHKTEKTMEGTYSSVVQLRSMRIAILAAELNGLEIMCGDISSAYLESYCREKVHFIAGPAFEELEGHLLVIVKALYGLRSSGASWHR